MLKFASICPHPPIIIPTIGSSSDLGKVSKTILAMERLAKIFQKAKPETVIIISPHGPVDYDRMTITTSSTLSGNFQQFGDYQTNLSFENDLEIVDLLQEKCKKANIPTRLIDNPELDHGSLVPLYYLTKNYTPPKGKALKVVPVAYSFLDIKTHFEFGKKIFEVCGIKDKPARNASHSDAGGTKKKRIALIASGDLSHRLTIEAPAGFSLKGSEFDEKIVELLKENNISEILNMNSDLIKEAGECGYSSIVTLLGALSQTRAKFKFLSYEGPFGVGYLVANFK